MCLSGTLSIHADYTSDLITNTSVCARVNWTILLSYHSVPQSLSLSVLVTQVCLTSTLVVTSRESNANAVFASQACLCATFIYGRPRTWVQLIANKDGDMEKCIVFAWCDVTSKGLVRQKLSLGIHLVTVIVDLRFWLQL